ncbi:hypothetical protein DL96DRAFT_1630796 [Flagelloscypha sp. PMI_526]|nr:hypothetical protein DL96DRAFT_1630796 [Flagelloscypha sp. PMI_526]
MATPIDDIPPEILQQIFHFYVKSSFSDPEGWEYRLRHPWHKALLPVCRNWNAVGCSTPELWSHVYTGWDIGTLDFHFAQSSGAALKFYLDATPATKTLEAITNLAERIETFQIYVKDIDELEDMFLHEDWDIPLFPNLKNFHFLLVEGYRDDDWNADVETNIESWIENNCPSLVNLEVRWNFLLDFSLLPHNINSLRLTSQALVDTGRDPDYQNGPITDLEWISPLKALRILELNGDYIPELEEDADPLDPLDLPYLETLHLSGTHIKAIERVLAAIICPPLLDMKVSGTLSSEKIEEPEQLIETILWMCQPIEGATDTLTVASEPKGLSAKWVRHWLDRGPSSNVAVDLHFAGSSLSFASSAYTDLVVQVWRAFTSETLSRVEVKMGGHCAFFPEDWLDTFGSASLKALEEIKVEDVRRQTSILTALAETETPEVGNERPLFPSLKRLHLRRFHFESQCVLVEPNDVPEPDDEPRLPVDQLTPQTTGEQEPTQFVPLTQGMSLEHQRLASTLICRRSLGFEIEELVLDKCFGLGADGVAELRSLVKNVTIH